MRYHLLVVEPARADASRLAAIFDPTRFALVWARDLGADRAGADAFVPKPIEPRAIVETAERLLPPTPRRRAG
jgi:hypothetical protein